MATVIPSNIKEWTRELLGARGFLKAWNDIAQRKKLSLIVDEIACQELAPDAVHNVFLCARGSRNALDDVLADLQRRERWIPSSSKVAAALSNRADARPVSDSGSGAAADRSEMDRLKSQIARLSLETSSLRAHASELENLVRALTERAVLDATRIKGLETVVMALADHAGVSGDAERAYFTATAQFIDDRAGFLASRRRIKTNVSALPLP